MRVAVIGATGLVGSNLLPCLANHQLLVLTRRPTGQPLEERVATASEWPSLLACERVDAAVSALGTTWLKARSWEVFEEVDRHAVVAFAKAARDSGARQFVLVSSVGADLRSASGYLALKARTESDLEELGFDRLDIFRPGLLRGPRGSDRRLKERLAILISPIANLVLRGRNDRFAAIPAKTVAAAIGAVIGNGQNGTFVHHNREIRALASHR